MRILLATDGSEPAGLAVNLVDSIGWPKGSTIEVVAVFRQSRDFTAIPVSTTTPEPPEVVGPVKHEPARWLDDALSAAVSQLDRPGRKVQRVMLTGRAGSAIVKEAKGFEPDLIVMGSRGLGGMRRMVLGSVSSEVVDHAARPVLVTRGPELRSLVFATDGSADSRAAERVLAEWPIFKGLPVTVVSVAETAIPISAGMASGLYDQVVGSYEGDLSEAAREVAAIAEAAANRLNEAGLVATPVLRGGAPAEQIVAVAEELGADLVVTGTRGHTGLARLVLGSVARNVVHHADCSVLVVRGKRKGRGRGRK
jgi:nucleotide-binding universal stress UspA family protein